MCAQGLGDVADGDFGLLDFRAGRAHCRFKFFLHGTGGLGFVGDKTEGLAQGVEAARRQRDIVGIFGAKELGEDNGALLFVEGFQFAQETEQRLFGVVVDIFGKLLGFHADRLQRILKFFALCRSGLQLGEQGIDGRPGDFRRFAQGDKGVRKRCSLFGGKTKLFGGAADT